MDQHIRYCKTADGVNIAYSVIGTGEPLVVASSIWGSLQMRRSWDGWERTFDGFHRQLIFYDGRGCGASDRNLTHYSVETQLIDLETVVDHLGVEEFAMYAHTQAVPAAISFAAHHPERVTQLVLAEGYADGLDWARLVPAMRVAAGLKDMADDAWESYTMTLATALLNFPDPATARAFAAACRAAMSPHDYLMVLRASLETDVRRLLRQLQTPTLLIDFTDGIAGTLPMMREMATAIANASLVEASVAESVAIIAAFLGQAAEHPRLSSGTAVILFADIVDSTALHERLGDAAFREKARELGPALRSVIGESGGTPVEGPTLGDGVLATFTSAREAIRAALRCVEAAEALGLSLHLGLHAGDVSREKDPDGRDNVYGGAVNIAARISGLSAPGEVLVSQTVRELARTSAGVAFEDRGEQALKGVSEAVRVWAVLREPQDELMG